MGLKPPFFEETNKQKGVYYVSAALNRSKSITVSPLPPAYFFWCRPCGAYEACEACEASEACKADEAYEACEV